MTTRSGRLTAVAIGLTAGLVFGACMQERVDDATISATVRSQLASDPELRGTSIGVASTDAVVVLTGRVMNDEQREKAEDVADDVAGVKEIENRIVVASAAEPMVDEPPDTEPQMPPVAAPPPTPEDRPRY
jgi:Flp pilus assembly secretin CpaC